MRAGAFLRLLLRPALLYWSLVGCGLLTASADFLYPAAPWTLTCLLAGLAGLLAGQAVQELQHTTVAWMLPGLRPRLLAGWLPAGLATAALATLAGRAAGASLPAPALFALGLFAFSLGSVVIDPLSGRGSIAALAAGVAVGAWVWRAPAPLAVAGISVLGAAICTRRAFARSTFRRKPSVPTVALLSSLSLYNQRRFAREKLAGRQVLESPWSAGAAAGGRLWLRAALHEQRGMRPGGWWAAVAGGAGGWALFLAVAAVISTGDEGRGLAHGVRSFAEWLFAPHFLVAFWFALLGLLIAWQSPLLLKSRLALPLSRRERARLANAGGLLALVTLSVAEGAAFYALGLLASLAGGPEEAAARGWALLSPLTVAAVFLPAVQWLRVREDADLAAGRGAIGRPLAMAVLGGLFALAVAVVHRGWERLAEPLGAPARAAILLAALALSQALYAWGVRRHYRRADLV
jgi:hypothetical protein